MKRYLLTMGFNCTTPHNHGLVEIDDRGWVHPNTPVETPIEDFGMYIVQDTPFPDDPDEQFNLFIALIAEQH